MDVDGRARSEQALVTGAISRICEALQAWLEEDFDRAAASAPMAVELLGKAVLWRANPTLLVQLESRAEKALVDLATAPNLESPSLRTIGLKVALKRLTLLVGELPVPEARQVRLVDCRNGALHVGALPGLGGNSAEVVSRHVLTDALTLCQYLMPSLELSSNDFFGERVAVVAGLLREHRSEVEHRVARRLAAARAKADSVRKHFDDDVVWERTLDELESGAADAFKPEDLGLEMGGVDHECPVCGHEGRLLGRVDVEGDVDVQGGADGPEYYGYWRVRFYPRAFGCNVCKVWLATPEELEAAGLAAQEREVSEEDLGPDFSASEWAEWMYGLRD